MGSPIVSALLAAFLVAGVLFVLIVATRVKSLEEMSLKELEEEIRSLKAKIRELKSIPGYSETVLAGFEGRLSEASSRLMIERVLARPEHPHPTPEEQEQIDALQKIDSMIVSSIRLPLSSLLGRREEAATLAQSLLNEAKEKLKAQNVDPYSTDFGSRLVQNEALLLPRLAAGLSKNDILQHWNRPICQIHVESGLRSTMALLFVRASELQGEDPSAASRQWRIRNPIYGSPENHDLASPSLVGLNPADAPIYEEFQARITAWSLKTDQERVNTLISEHGTYNAMVRALVSTGEL